MVNCVKPTSALYDSLQLAYQHFNRALFDAALPDVIFTVQRQRGVMGYFAPERWSSVEGRHCHEIAINPTHMGESRLIEVLQTLVHEMAHCWQHCFGRPSRQCYHNREWSDKMIAIGLQPSSTGAPGGKTTGQLMSDYPLNDGRFIQACIELVKNQAFHIPWLDRRSIPKRSSREMPTLLSEATAEVSEVDAAKVTAPQLLATIFSDLMPENTFIPLQINARPKQKYTCPTCMANVWGKPNLNLVCGECNIRFTEK